MKNSGFVCATFAVVVLHRHVAPALLNLLLQVSLDRRLTQSLHTDEPFLILLKDFVGLATRFLYRILI
jgi:hypothetical protein